MQKIHHGKPSRNSTMVWTNHAEIFIPRKRVENNHLIDNKGQPGLKMIDYHVYSRWEMKVMNVSAEQC